MSIKISELGNLNVFTDTTLILAVNTASPTLTTVKSTGLTLKNYVAASFIGNLQALEANAVTQQGHIWFSNVGLKGYVDNQFTLYSTLTYTNNAITTSNVALKGYVDFANTVQAGAITQANVAMKGYVDSKVVEFTANSFQQEQDIANINIILGNISTYSNANVTAYLPTHSGNVGGVLATNVQPYINQVGVLDAVNVSGNAWVATPAAGDVSNKIATTAFVQNIAWNSQGRKTISSDPPQGGDDGDIWYQV